MPDVRQGKNRDCIFDHFSNEEITIINEFGKEHYITNTGEKIKLSNSNYNYFLFKPAKHFSELFNIELEILALFSNYEKFEPRTLDAYDSINKRYQEYRIEKVCYVLISRDENITERIKEIVNNDPETPNIIPFTYQEFLGKRDNYFMRNRFQNYLFSRDLFDFSGPLKKDLYFYGRSDIINDILNRHRSSENYGLFGLRRTGKTSIIYGVKRAIDKVNSIAAIIDCQNTSFNQRVWYEALFLIIYEIKEQNGLLNLKTNIEEKYTSKNAAILFEEDLNTLYESTNKRIMIIFDEIERITFNISNVEHWRDKDDFIFFWQSIRAIYQKINNFTFLIAGTNPTCIEDAFIKKTDNPLFNQISHIYVPGFNLEQTKEMVKKLGRIMGIKFEAEIYSKLNIDYGGHPFLIRKFCSLINKKHPNRPITIDIGMYDRIKKDFEKSTSNIETILNILKEQYPDEYELLTYLAFEDYNTFNDFATLSKDMIRHLIGYGIISSSQDGNYYFKVEAIKNYIQFENQYKKKISTKEEKIAEISKRRNELEAKLRNIVRQQLIIKYGKNNIKNIISSVMTTEDAKKLNSVQTSDLFNPNKVKIYFRYITNLIEKEWDLFKNIFTTNKEECIIMLNTINKNRIDAHSANLTDSQFNYLRCCFEFFEDNIKEFM